MKNSSDTKTDILHCFANEPTQLDFVLPGMLHGSVGSLVSPGGAGKSYLALQIAIQIASGCDTLKWEQKLKQGKVVYLASEDAMPTTHARLHAIGKDMSIQHREATAENLHHHTLVGSSLHIHDPYSETGLDTLCQDARLIILDTLRRFHTKDENSSGEMSDVVTKLEELAKKTGASVLFLHHSNKSSALNNQLGEQQSSRGSSVLTDNVRWQGFLSTMGEKEAKEKKIHINDRKRYVRYGISKQNYGAPCEDIWFRRGKGGVLTKFDFDAEPENPLNKPRKKGEPKDGD